MSQLLQQQLMPYLVAAGLTDVSVIASLSQGLSNCNYYVRAKHPSKALPAEWVLRVNSWASSQICDRRNEIHAWQQVSQVNLAPDIVYVSPEYDFYLSEFLVQQGNQDWSQLISANSAHPITNNDSQWPNAEQLLLDLLNGLKNLPAPNNLMTVQTQWHIYRSRLASMHQQLTQQPNNEHPRQKAWLQRLSALIAQQDAIENMLLLLDKCIIRNQFSHRDLNPFNLLIVNGKLNCIDFEYACSSHPLCDLASVISSHTLSSEQRHWLIENYLQQQDNLNHHAQNAIPAAVDLYWVFAVCWALQMAFDCMMLDGNIIIDAASVEQTDGYLTCANQYQALIGRCS